MPPWQFVEAVQGVNTAGVASLRTMTFSAPLKMRAGDQLIALLASPGVEIVSGTNVAWEFVNSFQSATKGVIVYRRTVTDDEEDAYVFDMTVAQETLGTLLVYRGLDNAAAWVGGSGVDYAAATVFPCPSRTLTRYSDLYLGIVLSTPTAGGMSAPADGVERVEFTQAALGGATLRLHVFDFAANAVGATGVKNATDATAQAGMAASIALQGEAPLGPALTLSYTVPGAIGLPKEGI